MKKKSIISIVLVGILAIGLIGCGTTTDKTGSANPKEDKVIKVGVSPEPHREILDVVVPLLEKEGYTVEITEFNDYVQPNTAVSEGSLDANYFQTLAYLNKQNESKGLNLVSVGKVHLEPMGLYSKKIKSLDELKDGDTIAIPNDGSNEARALNLLAKNGIIKVNDGELITKKDIIENPKNLEFNELEAASIPRALDDVTAAIINGNYAIPAGFSSSKDTIIVEDADPEITDLYANIIAVRKGDENKEKIQALVKALISPEVKKFIEEKYDGAVIPVF